MKKSFACYFVLFVTQWILNFGMINAESCARWPSLYNREYIGNSTAMALTASLMPAFGLAIPYMMTGFAEYGLKFDFECSK